MSDRPAARGLLASAYLSFVLLGWNAVLLPSLVRSIEGAFHQSDAAFGLLYLVIAVFYAAGSFGGGAATERVGRRVVLSGGAALIGVGLAGAALAPSWLALLIAATVANCGAGVVDGGMNGLVLDLRPAGRGGALNRLHFAFSVGTLIAPAALGQALAAGAPWRALLLAPSLCCVALAVGLGAQAMPSGRHAPSQSAREVLTGTERTLLPFVALAIGIAGYVAAEAAVGNWLVKALAPAPVAAATAVLSIFGGGLALGRLLSARLADRFPALPFTLVCLLFASAALAAAVLAPSFAVAAVLYGVAGLGYGPVYPMIMAMGGALYPHRLAALSGGLAGAAAAGAIVYPPLMGLLAAGVGLRAGLVGAAALGVPTALALVAARAVARRAGEAVEPVPTA